ncbi:MAG: GNAT family N-acetyltransferase [Erythrobacter sp.]
MFHRSENLFLRPAWIEDAQAVTAGIAEEAVVRNLARAPWPYTLDDAVEFLSRPARQFPPGFLLTLPSRSGSQVIGMCGLNEEDGRIELGYWIARPHWGQGYATEAAKAVLDIARSIGIKRVHAGHFVDNPASGKVLLKAGFKPTGETRAQFSLARGHKSMSRRYAVQLDEQTEQRTGNPDAELKRAA